jgi:hypothetical protein
MGIKPGPLDDNGWRLLDSGTELGTDLITLTTGWQNLIFPIDVKQVSVYVVSGTLVLRGTVPIHRSYLDAAAVVNSGGGVVTIAATGHGLTDGDPVTFPTLTDYPGDYTVLAAGDADHIAITATYVAKTPAVTDYALGYVDPTYAAGAEPRLPLAVGAETVMAQVKASVACVISVAVVR